MTLQIGLFEGGEFIEQGCDSTGIGLIHDHLGAVGRCHEVERAYPLFDTWQTGGGH